MVTEIRIYKLKEGKSNEFLKVFTEQSLPLMKKWQVDVEYFGFAIDDNTSFHLIRQYKDLDDRNLRQEKFYNSDDWIKGPRKIILECIDYYNTTIFENKLNH